MIDYNKNIVSALKTVLPTYYELALTGAKAPCISYQERNNYSTDTGDTLGYSVIVYTIKVWGNSPAEINRYSVDVDKAMRAIGFKRTSSNELHDVNSTMIQKIMTFECLALEKYNNGGN